MNSNFTLIDRPSTQKLSRAILQEFATMSPLSRDRTFNENRYQSLKRKFDAGQFIPVVWASAYCEADGNTYRVNGQHTTRLFQHYAFESVSNVYVQIQRYRCATLEDVAALNSQFDSPISAKTASDIYGSFAASCPDLDQVSREVINIAIAGLTRSVFDDLNNATKVAQEDRAQLCIIHKDFVLWIQQFLRNKADCKLFRRAGVIAAAHKLYLRDSVRATRFLMAVRDGIVAAVTPPGRLREFLLTHGQGGRHGTAKLKVVSTPILHNVVVYTYGQWEMGSERMGPINADRHAELTATEKSQSGKSQSGKSQSGKSGAKAQNPELVRRIPTLVRQQSSPSAPWTGSAKELAKALRLKLHPKVLHKQLQNETGALLDKAVEVRIEKADCNRGLSITLLPTPAFKWRLCSRAT